MSNNNNDNDNKHPPLSISESSSPSKKRPRESRKNRWGPPPPTAKEANTNTISEEDAIAALISSAQSQIHESETHQRKPEGIGGGGGGGGGGFGNDRKKSKRWDDDNPSRRTTTARGRTGSANIREPPRSRNTNHNPTWGKDEKQPQQQQQHPSSPSTNETKQQPKDLANFGLSGALAHDEQTGNIYNGIRLKFTEPPEARTPNTRWRLYVFKQQQQQPSSSKGNNNNDEILQIMHISKQSAYLFGRDHKVADIPVDHTSLSRQHCVLQYRAVPNKEDANVIRCKPYLMDLGSVNGTFINGNRLEEARYYELKRKDVITLGKSSREYVLLTENTA